MDDLPPTPSAPHQGLAEERLDSWKEIAVYLKRDISTVQRWERREGMPVHRHLHDKLGSIYAFRTELDAWSLGRQARLQPDRERHDPVESTAPESGPANSPKRRVLSWTAAGLGLVLVAGAGAWAWLWAYTEAFWRSPLTNVRFEQLTDFEGTEQAAAISRDGQFVAFLSDRDGRPDIWITQTGTGQFYNLTRGAMGELANPSVRTIGFSPDGAHVLFWSRKSDGSKTGDINIWSVPVLGGAPRPYLQGVAELDWSADGGQLVYHTPGPGDPMFVTDAPASARGQPIFTAPPGQHAHFPLWSPDRAFIYFVQGTVPGQMDLWRMRATGNAPERVTFHNSRLSHPVFVDRRTLLYLVTEADGTGPRLYGLDVERRRPHRLSAGIDEYTSLAASADGRRLIVTAASPKATLWRVPITGAPADTAAAHEIPLTTRGASAPQVGPGYVLYISSAGSSESIWKLVGESAQELWRSTPGTRITGGPAIAADGSRVAFSTDEGGQTRLHVMNGDGTDVRLLTTSMQLRGSPAWSPDGQSITTGANEGGVSKLVNVPLNGGSTTTLLSEYATDPAWAPHGRYVLFTGADIGTTFPVKALAATSANPAERLPNLTLTRGARRLRFMPGHDALVVLRGAIDHKDLWLIDLATGIERQLTAFDPGFVIQDFDISPDGREIVVARVQEHSDIVLLQR